MFTYKNYNENERFEEAWFDSTMIYYTKMVENPTENKGDLYVVFKNGGMYKYKDVELSDYVLFISGGVDGSQGKTLNKVIKGKYEFEKCESASIDLLEKRKVDLIIEDKAKEYRRSHSVFVSGYEDITNEEFEFYYQPELANSYEDTLFIVGDKKGCDIMVQNFLFDILNVSPERVTVYHCGDKPENVNPKAVRLIGGFEGNSEADDAMTKNSSKDIAFVRDEKEQSVVSANILRRFKFK